ncbi:MAG: hypothetical protein KAR20_27240, partial [Candidatus Heimdallarchaeota archaeon]|nr:hypothetical protein [Candidatus Heimdallarchaeota archaeon]
ANQNMPQLLNQSAKFIDKPATQRLIQNNLRYITTQLTGNSWNKIWNTPTGRESITFALAESLHYAASLPAMGSLVPFGSTCEFIPAVECFKFALETGKNPPFKDINIEPIYRNDKRKISRENGNFKFELEIGIPRGEIIAVAVYGHNLAQDKIIGEIYDADRLIEKAKTHSASYRTYLEEKSEFLQKKSEGKTKIDNEGNHFYEKKIEWTDKDSGKPKSFFKKIFEHSITNPYEGADRPEMLRKSAGKSFLSPYMKVRDAMAMADEWTGNEDEMTPDQEVDSILNQAANQFKESESMPEEKKESEIEPEHEAGSETTPVKETAQNQEPKQDDMFSEN